MFFIIKLILKFPTPSPNKYGSSHQEIIQKAKVNTSLLQAELSHFDNRKKMR